MRAASYAAGTLIAVSSYLIIAATVAITPLWIAAGAVGIALIASVAFVARSGATNLTA